ncbi:MAG: hypothetical protein E7675_06130 [Ruminococcaceae bacterium]|nr:hypothetical protein [Oscillospiraceae bacterium]
MDKRIIGISYPTPIETVEDVYNDNIDVIVHFDDETSICVVVATPDNLKWQMKNEDMRYLPAGEIQIIVSELKDEIIKEALIDYCDNYRDFFKKIIE